MSGHRHSGLSRKDHEAREQLLDAAVLIERRWPGQYSALCRDLRDLGDTISEEAEASDGRSGAVAQRGVATVSLNRYDKRCPECGSAGLDEQGRVEGGFTSTTGEDTAIIRCQQCGHTWDTEMPYVLPSAQCGAHAAVWLNESLICIRFRGHKGTIHEDETEGTWDAEELETSFPDE